MDKVLALVVSAVAGLLGGYFAMYLFSDTFNTLGWKAAGGALAGAVFGGLSASMVGSESNRQSDLGVNLILGIVIGLITGMLGGTRFEIISYVISEVRSARLRS